MEDRAEQLPSPSLLRHLTAMIYDLLLIIALVAVVIALALALTVQLSGDEVLSPVLAQVLVVASVWGFFCAFWLKGGQTLGMQAWRIRLVCSDGGKLRADRALARCAAATLSLACLGLGYLWKLVDREGLYWHDRLTGTRLVLLPKRS